MLVNPPWRDFYLHAVDECAEHARLPLRERHVLIETPHQSRVHVGDGNEERLPSGGVNEPATVEGLAELVFSGEGLEVDGALVAEGKVGHERTRDIELPLLLGGGAGLGGLGRRSGRDCPLGCHGKG